MPFEPLACGTASLAAAAHGDDSLRRDWPENWVVRCGCGEDFRRLLPLRRFPSLFSANTRPAGPGSAYFLPEADIRRAFDTAVSTFSADEERDDEFDWLSSVLCCCCFHREREDAGCSGSDVAASSFR